jgi:tetratricopeptide (TPR) repeat protein
MAVWLSATSLYGAPPSTTFEYQGLKSKDEILKSLSAVEAKLQAKGLQDDKPACAALQNEKAICLYFLGNWKDSLESLDAAIRTDPKPAYYTNRGMIKRISGDRDGAKADYIEALKIDKVNGPALNNLAWLLLDEAQTKTADNAKESLLNEVLDRLADAQKSSDSDVSTLARVNMAAAYLVAGKVDKAGEALKDVDVENAALSAWVRQVALLNKGEVCRCGGDWEQARKYYQKAYDLSEETYLPQVPSSPKNNKGKENPWILRQLGAAEFVLGEHKQAKEHLDRAREAFGTTSVEGRYAGLLAVLCEAKIAKSEKVSLSVVKEPRRWIDALEMYMAGQLDSESLARCAEDENPQAAKAKQSEMYFYVWQKKLLENQPDPAAQARKKCAAGDSPCCLERTMCLGKDR